MKARSRRSRRWRTCGVLPEADRRWRSPTEPRHLRSCRTATIPLSFLFIYLRLCEFRSEKHPRRGSEWKECDSPKHFEPACETKGPQLPAAASCWIHIKDPVTHHCARHMTFSFSAQLVLTFQIFLLFFFFFLLIFLLHELHSRILTAELMLPDGPGEEKDSWKD